jgi:hypothetical protein
MSRAVPQAKPPKHNLSENCTVQVERMFELSMLAAMAVFYGKN